MCHNCSIEVTVGFPLVLDFSAYACCKLDWKEDYAVVLCSHNHGHCIAKLSWHLSMTYYNPGPGCLNAG